MVAALYIRISCLGRGDDRIGVSPINGEKLAKISPRSKIFSFHPQISLNFLSHCVWFLSSLLQKSTYKHCGTRRTFGQVCCKSLVGNIIVTISRSISLNTPNESVPRDDFIWWISTYFWFQLKLVETFCHFFPVIGREFRRYVFFSFFFY